MHNIFYHVIRIIYIVYVINGEIMKNGFTLSEILITLGIIGVVAAITLPTLINKIQEKQFHSKFKKAYATFSQAAQKIYNDDGEFTVYDWTVWSEYICKLGNHIKIINSGTSCANKYPYVRWHNDLEWFNQKGDAMSFSGNPYYALNTTFTTIDGTMYILNCGDKVLVDVNGFKKPNKIGKDIYYFQLRSNTNQPYYSNSAGVPDCNNNAYTKPINITDNNYKEDCLSGSGWGCSRMVINNEL